MDLGVRRERLTKALLIRMRLISLGFKELSEDEPSQSRNRGPRNSIEASMICSEKTGEPSQIPLVGCTLPSSNQGRSEKDLNLKKQADLRRLVMFETQGSRIGDLKPPDDLGITS